MVRTVPIQQAAIQLAALVRGLQPGDQIVLIDGARPVGRIVPEPQSKPHHRAGACKGRIEILDDSEDAVLDQFRDYLP